MLQNVPFPQLLLMLLATILPTATDAIAGTEESSRKIVDMAREGNLSPRTNLIAEGPQVDARDNLDRTPLHKAAAEGDVAAIMSLIGQGAKIDARDKLDYTPLYYAVDTHRRRDEPMPQAEKDRRLAAVKLLVAAGADVNPRNDYERTPLHLAARSNLPRAIGYLVEQGAEIDTYSSDGLTPLHVAAGASRSVEALKKFIELGADPNLRRKPPPSSRDVGIDMTFNTLSVAALWGNLEAVKFLLEKDVPTRYGSGESEHSALYDALIGASTARKERADKEQIAQHFAVIDLLAKEMGGINAGVKHGSFDGTALEVATAPYVARHLLTKYSKEFTAENIDAAIAELEKEINSRSRGIRDEPEETLPVLRKALLVYGIFEAKQREQNGDLH